MVFVDNAGVDFVLGILPLVRELVKQNTDVVIAANSCPALNDITYKEAQKCIKRAADECLFLKQALIDNKVIIVQNGQSGPCLDLSDIHTGKVWSQLYVFIVKINFRTF